MRGWPLIKLLPQKTNFHFVKYARFAGVLSVVLCIAAIVSCFYPGLNMGIDFRGGASMEVSKPAGQVLALDELRGEARVRGICDDLLSFPAHLTEPPEAILCMGDTITHLPDGLVGGCALVFVRLLVRHGGLPEGVKMLNPSILRPVADAVLAPRLVHTNYKPNRPLAQINHALAASLLIAPPEGAVDAAPPHAPAERANSTDGAAPLPHRHNPIH